MVQKLCPFKVDPGNFDAGISTPKEPVLPTTFLAETMKSRNLGSPTRKFRGKFSQIFRFLSMRGGARAYGKTRKKLESNHRRHRCRTHSTRATVCLVTITGTLHQSPGFEMRCKSWAYIQNVYKYLKNNSNRVLRPRGYPRYRRAHKMRLT